MYDPMTVAFEIKSPFRKPSKYHSKGYWRPALITIWHVDPEKDGTDNSCDWFGSRWIWTRKAGWLPADQDWFDGLSSEGQGIVRVMVARTRQRPWYKHPKYHIQHWRVQIHPLQDLKRFLFTRCAGCGKHFSFGYSPISHQWDAPGPRWFKSEPKLYHDKCDQLVNQKTANAKGDPCSTPPAS